MFKLPVCPYCHTVYDYKEVKNKKDCFECYHCKNKIKVKKARGFACLFIIICIIDIIINMMILTSSDFKYNIVLIFITSMISVIIGLLLMPYFTIFSKEKIKKIKEDKI